MIIVKLKNNIQIRLTTERWEHIIKRHPEMENQKDHVLETITNPDFIQKGDFSVLIAVKFYEKSPLTSKYLVTMYKEALKSDGFVITAYYVTKPSERRQKLWK
jgi:hypothetical protein